MTTLWLDTETYSEIPITHGTHRYAEGAEVMLVSLAIDDCLVNVWDTQDIPDWPQRLQNQIDSADEIVIQNSAFDRTVLRIAHGVNIPVEKITDTMVVALMHSLPAQLGQLCEALGVPADKAKDKDGKRLIHLFCKPQPKNRKIRRATRETHPEDWEKFKSYAGSDITAMRECLKRMPRWNDTPEERELWHLDQRINDRGIKADLELAEKAQEAFRRSNRIMAARIAELTEGAVHSATQREKLLNYMVLDRACYIEDMTKGTLAAVLKDADLPPGTRELLEIRQQAAATSPAKYRVVRDGVSADGRLRGLIQFCGAGRTGRDAGRLFQPQNLPRPTLKPHVIEQGITAIKADCEDLLFDNVSELCVNAVRGCLVAEEGKKLVVADLSNIEGRVVAWLAGEDWKIAAFRAFDAGTGPDLYHVTAASVLGKRVEDITKDERQKNGKVPDLACAYQGSVGAFDKMGANYGVFMPEEQVLEIVRAWRKKHPRINSLWYDVEYAAKSAIHSPGESFKVRGLTFDMRDGWLRMRLPSGRYLSYPDAQIGIPCRTCAGLKTVLDEATKEEVTCPACGGTGLDDTQIRYWGLNQYTRKWEMLETYGGKLCIAAGTPVLTDHGWLPIEHVKRSYQVWDGVAWVSHKGLVRKGVKEVICAHGVWMTPDHELLTTKGWVRASQSAGHQRADARVSDGLGLFGQQWPAINVDAAMRLRQQHRDGGLGVLEAAETGRAGLVRLPPERDYRATQHDARDVETQGLCHLAFDERPVRATNAPILAQLRRTWDHGLRALADLVSGLLGRHGADIRRGPDTGAEGQQRRLPTRELLLGEPSATSAQQTAERHGQHAVGLCHCGRGRGSGGLEPVDGVLPSLGGGERRASVGSSGVLAEVFDLIDCGPLHRFTVASEDGTPLIVHNCENAVQAIARDIFLRGMRRAELAGYPVVLRVHDELGCEVPDLPEFTAEELSGFMTAGESWTFGLPLAAAGGEMYRYAKED